MGGPSGGAVLHPWLGRQKPRGVGGYPQLGKVRPLHEIPIATSCQRPTVTCGQGRHHRVEAATTSESTHAFLSDPEPVPRLLWVSASHLQRKRKLELIFKFKGGKNKAEPTSTCSFKTSFKNSLTGTKED